MDKPLGNHLEFIRIGFLTQRSSEGTVPLGGVFKVEEIWSSRVNLPERMVHLGSLNLLWPMKQDGSDMSLSS